jgi:hypothetical protein
MLSMWGSTRLVVAFEADSVCGAMIGSGPGAARVKAFARAEISPGALTPAAFEPNLVRGDEVGAALEQVRRLLDVGSRGVCVVVPDGLARTALLDFPSGVDASDFARFRLASGLPFPESDAIVDSLPVGRRQLIAAAARRAVLAEYEVAVAEAGFRQERLTLAPLAAVAGLLKNRESGARAIDVILGVVAVTIVSSSGSAPCALRNRRRSGHDRDWEWLSEEIQRSAPCPEASGPIALNIVGHGSRDAIAALRTLGHTPQAGWVGIHAPSDAADAAWLGGLE